MSVPRHRAMPDLGASLAVLRKALRTLPVIVGITTIFATLVNLVAARFLTTTEIPVTVLEASISPRSPQGVALHRKIFAASPDPDGPSRFSTASRQFAFHPTLHFMVPPVHNKHYHIGLEGIRYHPGWDD